MSPETEERIRRAATRWLGLLMCLAAVVAALRFGPSGADYAFAGTGVLMSIFA